MKKELGILLLVFIAAVGLSSAASAQSIYTNNVQSPVKYNNGYGWHVAWKNTWKWSSNPTRHSYKVIKINMPQYRQTVVKVLKRSRTTGNWYVVWRHTWKWSAHPTKNSYRAVMINIQQHRQTTVLILKKGHHNWQRAAIIR
ncbi:hypothetical protein [Methanobacterium sp.]|uniref:hypothetical protein n=1 Tax=Methanobacterium sp. TaxID=2164 RepID=UPI003C78EB88